MQKTSTVMWHKWRIAVLTVWVCVATTFSSLLAQTVTVLSDDKVRETVNHGEPTFACFAIPPRSEHGLLYAPLRVHVLITNATDISIIQTNIFAEARFLTDRDFQMATQSLQEVAIHYGYIGYRCQGVMTTCVWRNNRYIQAYDDRAFMPKDSFQTNFFGQWTGRDFGKGRKNRLTVSTDGMFQLETYDYTVAGSVKGGKSEGRLWATPTRLILAFNNRGPELYALVMTINSITLRHLTTYTIGGLSETFTKDPVGITDPGE